MELIKLAAAIILKRAAYTGTTPLNFLDYMRNNQNLANAMGITFPDRLHFNYGPSTNRQNVDYMTAANSVHDTGRLPFTPKPRLTNATSWQPSTLGELYGIGGR